MTEVEPTLDEPTLDELIEYFAVASALESTLFQAFVECRMAEKPVTALFGIAGEAAKKLSKYNIYKAWQLLGYVINSKKEDTVPFLIEHGVSAAYAKRVAYGLLLNFRKNCGD
jgi:hypothetical protein